MLNVKVLSGSIIAALLAIGSYLTLISVPGSAVAPGATNVLGEAGMLLKKHLLQV